MLLHNLNPGQAPSSSLPTHGVYILDHHHYYTGYTSAQDVMILCAWEIEHALMFETIYSNI